MKYSLTSAFLLLILQKMSNEISCGNGNKLTRNDCFANSTSEEFCCYNGSDSTCYPVSKNELDNNTLDCGISDLNYGKYEFGQYYPSQTDLGLGLQSCGKPEPKHTRDCTDYSQLTNSCCRFKKENGGSGCFFIGKKYLEKSKEKTFKFNNTDISYECNSFNLIPKLFLLLLLLFL